MANAKAASVPGRNAMCSWHFSAVSLLRGSMQINLAPLRLASCAIRQKCKLLPTELLPQMMMSFDSAKNSTRMPILAPKV